MTTNKTEIIFLTAKESVRPEDVSSEAGNAFLGVLARTAPAFETIIWGRSVDKPNIIGIAVDLGPSGDHFPLHILVPFQVFPPSILVLPAKAGNLVRNPVTEVSIIPLRETLGSKEVAIVAADAQTFGRALLAAPAPPAHSGKMALAYQSGIAEPSPRNRLVMLIGWREVQNHMDASETNVFQEHLAPIMEKIGAKLDVTHFHFVKSGTTHIGDEKQKEQKGTEEA